MALLMDPGTGKTITAVAIVGYRFLKRQVKKVLVVAPKSVVPVWGGRKNEFKKFADYPFQTVELKKGRRKPLQFPSEPGKALVAVTTYQSAWRMAKNIIKWKPDMVILDESHNIKNGRSIQARFLHKLSRNVQYKLILTGTPVSESPLDFHSQYVFLDPTIFGHNFGKFRSKYAIMGGFMRKQVKRYKNLKDLSRKAHTIAYRVRKEDCTDLPPVTTLFKYCELTEKAKSLYNEMKKEFVIEIGQKEISAPLVISQMQKLQQIAGGFVKDEDGDIHEIGKDKLNLLKETIEESKGKKLVIFARYVPEIEAIQKLCTKMKMETILLYGKSKNREAIVEKFQDGKLDAIIVQIKTGGVGITLTAADMTIIYSSTFSNLDYEQALARTDRIGQTKPTTVVHLACENTIDEEIFEALVSKRNLAELVIDKYNPNGGKDMKGKFVNEHPEVVEKLEELKQAIESGRKVNPDPARIPNVDDDSPLSLVLLRGGVEVMRVGEFKEEKAKEGKSKKEKKEKRPEIIGEIVTIKDLADELKMEPTDLRKRLRGSDLEKPSGRWEWPIDHKDLAVIRKWK
jgi:SNF2 family DNA or RNA helicase